MGKIMIANDRELSEFRDAMTVPSTFTEGFNLLSLLGAVFIGLIMVPGAIYMGLLAGQGIGPSAQWVTVIIFIELAKRAHRRLDRAEIFVLFFMAGAMMGGTGMGSLLWNQFYARSEAAAAYGIAENLPSWFAPPMDSESYAQRSFLHRDWLPVIALAIFGSFFGQIQNMVLGYGLFRVASDMENLPFPMAPIGAQGILALSEEADAEKGSVGRGCSWRWRVFSIGGALGLAFGIFYLFLPTITGALVGQTLHIFPIPFSDFTSNTQELLPAIATGVAWDLGNLVVGMVLPFYAVMGSFVGIVLTVICNPMLYHQGILHSWVFGDDTVTTIFKNNVDFYFSFQIGIALAVAALGIRAVIVSARHMASSTKGLRQRASRPEGRGDIPAWGVITSYVFITMLYILLSGWLINWHPGIMAVLVFLGFVYTPAISYATARLEGMVGQVVEVPFIREACLIFSGYRGVTCWFLPMPVANYGAMTVFYRQCELTGTKFTSIWKSSIVLYPIILIASLLFMNFIWGLADAPSSVYPYAQKMWPLDAANASIMYSATLGDYSIFEEAWNPHYLAAGGVFGGTLLGALHLLGAPIMLGYGIVRGLGALPHIILPQFIGALLGRFYFRRLFGITWRQYAPVLAAGYACGIGLITTIGVGITFLSKAVVELPY